MKLFLTGSTGFIGNALVRRLLNVADKIHLLIRPESSFHFHHPKIQIFRGGLADPSVLREGMRGCDGLFHLAARVGVYAKDPLLFDRINVQGTRNIIDAAIKTGVKKIVYTSSVVTLGATDGWVANEKTLRRFPFLTDYERTKALAEKEVEDAIHQGLPAVIVAPSLVFGPTVSLRFDSFNSFIMTSIKKRVIWVPGDGEHLINMVYIDDVVNGHLLALEKGEIGEKYILGGENRSIRKVIEEVVSILNKERSMMPIPYAALKPLVWIEWLMARFHRRMPRTTPHASDIYRHDWAYSSQKAIEQIDYQYRPFREGLEETIIWLGSLQK